LSNFAVWKARQHIVEPKAGRRNTHGQYYIDQVHGAQNDNANTGVVVAVGKKEQGNGEDVVGEHLGVVFPLLLDIDHQNLGNPEGPLRKVVELGQTGDLAEWPAFPHAVQVEEVFRVPHDVL
jgi:hypothetical protein